jgi:DNA-binding response OmpR family regulator
VTERPPHLVIIDWNMPGLAALEVIQGVRKARLPQAVRLIILSALSGEQDVVTGLNLGADDYISKPFSLREGQAVESAGSRVSLARVSDVTPRKNLQPDSTAVSSLGRRQRGRRAHGRRQRTAIAQNPRGTWL